MNQALADDFPGPLLGAAWMYAPGRIPLTGGRHNFIHEHGLIALTQLAIVHCRHDVLTGELTPGDFGTVCRLLLVLNDFLSPRPNPPDHTLRSRRNFAVNSLYYYQFNHHGGDVRASMTHLARLERLLTSHLPKYLPAVETEFMRRAGIGLHEYFLTAAFLLSYIAQLPQSIDRVRSPWTTIDSFVEHVKAHADEIRHVLSRFCQPPEVLKLARRERSESDLFDFKELQRHPLIEGRPGQILIPALSVFLRQLLNFPIQILSDVEQGLTKLGDAYEDYAHSLVERIARGDRRQRWEALQNREVDRGEVDSVMWNGTAAFVFEHKAKNMVQTIGDFRAIQNALGPRDEDLAKVHERIPRDTSAITHGLWQLARAAPGVEKLVESRSGSRPASVVPIVTTLERFYIDNWIRDIYLLPLMRAASLQFPPGWSQVEWLHATDLEAVAELADRRDLDLVDLFSARGESSDRFDSFIAKRYGSIPVDATLLKAGGDLLRAAIERYFKGPFDGTPGSEANDPGTGTGGSP